MNGMTIGKLAKSAGVSTDTVRFYERCGLLLPPARSPSNYRLYPEKEVLRLKFIVNAKRLGFTLNEIKELLSLRYDPRATKKAVKSVTKVKIEKIKKQIAELQHNLAILERLVETCDGEGWADDCPILAAMGGEEKQPCLHAHYPEYSTEQSQEPIY